MAAASQGTGEKNKEVDAGGEEQRSEWLHSPGQRQAQGAGRRRLLARMEDRARGPGGDPGREAH